MTPREGEGGKKKGGGEVHFIEGGKGREKGAVSIWPFGINGVKKKKKKKKKGGIRRQRECQAPRERKSKKAFERGGWEKKKKKKKNALSTKGKREGGKRFPTPLTSDLGRKKKGRRILFYVHAKQKGNKKGKKWEPHSV